MPDDVGSENFVNKWHHLAIAYRNKQMKIYLDQNRLYVIPEVKDAGLNKFGVRVSGKCVVTNIRLAEGGGMNMLGKKFTDAKIVTHGINFDVDKAIIKPESMGTLNMIVQVLKDNPDLKFEIDGHTDNSGNAAHNLQLSQQRSDAVKAQLISMGITASRLSTKGFGDTKPVSDNTTPEGKANNRRVEFVKI
jgi:outer membrane protein OmpA-like peptidoglycan-associated protein